ncbi:unnamed protein product, partial [Iphiclides podalirius]
MITTANLQTIFVTSQKGKRLIKLDGYTFYSSVNTGFKIRWRCSTGCHQGCRAAIYTADDEIISVKNDHNHPPSY